MTARGEVARVRDPGHQLSRQDGDRLLAEEEERRDRNRSRIPRGRTNRPGHLDAPDFVIIGAKVDAGVRIYASRDLKDAEFGIDEIQHQPEHVVTSVLRRMLVITRPTYPECMAELQRLWASQDAAKAKERQVTQGRKALPRGAGK
jgi:hypothetical protein